VVPATLMLRTTVTRESTERSVRFIPRHCPGRAGAGDCRISSVATTFLTVLGTSVASVPAATGSAPSGSRQHRCIVLPGGGAMFAAVGGAIAIAIVRHSRAKRARSPAPRGGTLHRRRAGVQGFGAS
jgi:hypothetical protein